MRHCLQSLALLLLPVIGQSADLPQLKISEIYRQTPLPTNAFVVEGTVIARQDSPQLDHLVLTDSTGGIAVKNLTARTFRSGDVIRIRGNTDHMEAGLPWIEAREITFLRHDAPIACVEANPEGIARGDYNFRPVRIKGVVTDIVPDDLGPHWSWLILEEFGAKTVAPFRTPKDGNKTLHRLIDSVVSITGIVEPDIGFRKFIRPYVFMESPDAITVLEPPPANPFDADLFHYNAPDPTQPIPRFARRQRISGQLVASWRNRYLFVRTGRYRNVLVRLGETTEIPAPGSSVSAVGFVSLNTFYARMDNALIRKDADACVTDEIPLELRPNETLSAGDRNTRINPTLNGRIVRVAGTARNVYHAGSPDMRMDVDCDGYLISVEIGRFPAPEPGSRVEITGAFVMETTPEYEGLEFSRLRGFSVVPRFPSDILILAGPPWWTPAKFSALIGLLILLAAALILRNRQKERQSRRESQLRIDERTRLAVELHDSLAQNLTGISLQLDAAEMAEEDRATALTHLSNAREALRSCREGLRYCLSDLRSRSFEGTDMTEAVSETVRPHIGKTHLAVRFNVPRNRLSDTSAHAVLCIIRELAVNAVRHGHATDIRVAGEFVDGNVNFSVRDNGCSFDPKTCPGSAQGHFGLMGVRERVQNLNGRLAIDSAPGRGTKITVTLRINSPMTKNAS